MTFLRKTICIGLVVMSTYAEALTKQQAEKVLSKTREAGSLTTAQRDEIINRLVTSGPPNLRGDGQGRAEHMVRDYVQKQRAEEETRRAEAERVAKEEDAATRIQAVARGHRVRAARAREEETAWNARVTAPTPNPDGIPRENKVMAGRVDRDLNTANLGPDATDPQLKTAAVNLGGTLGFNVKHFYQVIEVKKINDGGPLEVALVKTTHAFPSDRRHYVKNPIATITTDSRAIIEGRLGRPLQLGNRLLIKGLTRVGGAEQTQFVPDGNSNWKFIVYS